MQHHLYRHVALLFAAAVAAAPAHAQVQPRDSTRTCGPDTPAESCTAPVPIGPDRPAAGTDGLVLSGGGSRGLAHPGSLMALEERGFDADIVTGTSIGALVGALYAVGYPAADIQRQVEAVDWGELFTATPVVIGPERAVRYPLLSYDRQADPLRFNRGIVPQWRMNRALVRLLFDGEARARGDFDRLARRFRAVATDLRTGEPVVLGRGDLARAVRASFAVPGVFAPVEWEGRTLIDGGIADNLPIEPARRLGARYIVAVDVGRPSEEIASRGPFAVIGRTIDLLQDLGQRDSVPPQVWIVPPLPPTFGGITFPGDPTPLFRIGYQAVAQVADTVRFTGRPRRTLPAPPTRFSGLVIEAPDSALAAYARAAFASVAPGEYAPERVLTTVDRLYTTGLFEGIWPRVEGDGAEAARLVVRVEAPPRFSLAGAIGYDSDRFGRAFLSVQQSASVAGAPAVANLSGLATAREQMLSADMRLYPVRLAPFVASTGAYFRETDVRFVRRGDDVEVTRTGVWGSLELHQLLAERVAQGVVRAEWIDVAHGGGGWSFGPLLRVSEPQSERPIVGVTALAEAEARWGGYQYQQARARGSYAMRRGVVLAALVADAATVFGDAPPDVVPALGDEHLVPGYRWGEGRGSARLVGGADAAYPIPGGAYLRTRLRAGAVGRGLGRVVSQAPWAVGGDVGLFYQSPFGALSLAVGMNNRSEPRVVIDLGPEF